MLSRAPAVITVLLLTTGCVGANGKATNAGAVAGEVAANVAMAAVATAAQGTPQTGDHSTPMSPMTSCERQRREWWTSHPEADTDHLPPGFKCTQEHDETP